MELVQHSNAGDRLITLGRPVMSAFPNFSVGRQQHAQNTTVDSWQIAAIEGCLLESAAVNQNEIHASTFVRVAYVRVRFPDFAKEPRNPIWKQGEARGSQESVDLLGGRLEFRSIATTRALLVMVAMIDPDDHFIKRKYLVPLTLGTLMSKRQSVQIVPMSLAM